MLHLEPIVTGEAQCRNTASWILHTPYGIALRSPVTSNGPSASNGGSSPFQALVSCRIRWYLMSACTSNRRHVPGGCLSRSTELTCNHQARWRYLGTMTACTEGFSKYKAHRACLRSRDTLDAQHTRSLHVLFQSLNSSIFTSSFSSDSHSLQEQLLHHPINSSKFLLQDEGLHLRSRSCRCC